MTLRARILITLGVLALPLSVAGPAHGDQTLHGELVVAIGEDRSGATSYSAAVRTGEKFVPVAGQGVEHLEPGSKVALRVAPASEGVYQVRSIRSVAPARPAHPGPIDPGTHEIITAVVTPKGAKPDAKMTKAAVVKMVTDAAAFWGDQGSGVPFTNITYAGEFTSDFACDEYWLMWDEAAARTGFHTARGKHLVLVLPRSAYLDDSCFYGLGTVGGDVTYGGFSYVSALSTTTVAHELGHNLGLMHAAAFADHVGETLDGEWAIEYYDPYDVMGFGFDDDGKVTPGNLNARQQQRVGLLPPGEYTTVRTTSTITLQALDRITGTGHPRLAHVADPVTGVTYHLEYRPKVGRDINGPSWVEPGVVVRVDNPRFPIEAIVVDTQPKSGYIADAALRRGEAWTSKGGGVHVVVRHTSTRAAQIDVIIGTAVTVPTITLDKVKPRPTYRTSTTPLTARVSHDAPGKVTFRAVRADGITTNLGTATIVDGVATLKWTPKPTKSKAVAVRATYVPAIPVFKSVQTARNVKINATPARMKVTTSRARLKVNVKAASTPARGKVKIAAKSATTGKTWRITRTLNRKGNTVVNLRKRLPAGVYHLKVTYTGDKAVRGYRTITKVTRERVMRTGKKATPKVQVRTTKADPRKVRIKVRTKGGPANGRVVLKAKGKRIVTKLANGTATVRLPGNKRLTWKATYTGNTKFTKATRTFTRAALR